MKPELNDILNITLNTLGVSREIWDTFHKLRIASIVKVKKHVCLVAYENGHSCTDISSFLGMHRTTLLYYMEDLKSQISLYEDSRETMQLLRNNIAMMEKKQLTHTCHGWLCRTQNGALMYSPTKPEKVGPYYLSVGCRPFHPQESFPQITFETGPVKIRIKLTVEEDEKV